MAPVWPIWHAPWNKEERMWLTAGSLWGRQPMSSIMAPFFQYPGSWGKRTWLSSAWPGTPLAATLQIPSLPGSSVKVTLSLLSPGASDLRTYTFFSSWSPCKQPCVKTGDPWELTRPVGRWQLFQKLGHFPCASTYSFFKGTTGKPDSIMVRSFLWLVFLFFVLVLVSFTLIMWRERGKGRVCTIFCLHHHSWIFLPHLFNKHMLTVCQVWC